MNRQTKRMLQRQGQVEADGTPARRPVSTTTPPQRQQSDKGRVARIGDFLRNVRAELRRVIWPDRAEVANYSAVVFITLVLLLFTIFGLNWAFSHFVRFLFGT